VAARAAAHAAELMGARSGDSCRCYALSARDLDLHPPIECDLHRGE
jgi:hypothetical protein